MQSRRVSLSASLALRAAFALATSAFLALSAAPAHADTWLIEPGGGGAFPTIQSAFDSDLVQSGDEVVLAEGVFSGPGNTNLDPGVKELTIRSAGEVPQRCIIDCGGTQRGFWLHGNQTQATEIQGLTIRNAYVEGDCPFCSGGAILCADSLYLFNGASPRIVNCIFRDCAAEETGGAMFVNTFSAPVIRDCRFTANEAKEGGALCLNTGYAGAAVRIEDCVFDANRAHRGGAILDMHGGPQSGYAVEIEGSVLRNNIAALVALLDKPTAAGGVYVWGGRVAVRQCTFDGNSGTQLAGGIYLEHAARMDVLGTIVTGSSGAAVACDATSMIDAMTCCDLFQNSGGDWVGCAAAFAPAIEPSNLSIDPQFCDAGAADYFLAAGSPCLPGGACAAGIGAHAAACDQAGVGESHDPHDARDPNALPESASVLARFTSAPNPSLASVELSYRVESDLPATLTIHDPAGRLVRVLDAGQPASAMRSAVWDGRDEAGRRVPAGAYVARLRVGTTMITQRLIRVE
jgi:hypothetical protein